MGLQGRIVKIHTPLDFFQKVRSSCERPYFEGFPKLLKLKKSSGFCG